MKMIVNKVGKVVKANSYLLERGPKRLGKTKEKNKEKNKKIKGKEMEKEWKRLMKMIVDKVGKVVKADSFLLERGPKTESKKEKGKEITKKRME